MRPSGDCHGAGRNAGLTMRGQQSLCAPPSGGSSNAGFTALPGCGWLILVGYTGGPTCYLTPSPQALGGGQSLSWLHSFAGLRLAVLLKGPYAGFTALPKGIMHPAARFLLFKSNQSALKHWRPMTWCPRSERRRHHPRFGPLHPPPIALARACVRVSARARARVFAHARAHAAR